MKPLLVATLTALAFFVPWPAKAAPACLPEDSAALCEVAQATLADNPSFRVIASETRADEAARMRRQADRRAQARALLNGIASPTWRDLYRAGYVIGYGDTPEENLLAHAIAIRALSLAPNEPDTHFLVAMTFDEIGRRYVGAQVYGRQKYFAFDEAGAVQTACLPQMIDPPLPASVGAAFHTPAEGLPHCPAGVGESEPRVH